MLHNTAYISLGSNLFNGSDYLSRALELIIQPGDIIITKDSGIYLTAPLNGIGREYYNSVIMIVTSLSFEALNLFLKDIERKMGRDEEARLRKIVTIDLDTVIFNDRIVRFNDFQQEYFKKGYILISDR